MAGATILVTVGFCIVPIFAQQPINLFAEILPVTGGTKIENLDFKTIVPEPIKNLADKASGFQMNLNDFPKLKSAVESVKGVIGNPADIIKDPGSWWTRMNNWLHAKIGFDFRELAKFLGNLALSVLDILKEVLSWIVSKI